MFWPKNEASRRISPSNSQQSNPTISNPDPGRASKGGEVDETLRKGGSTIVFGKGPLTIVLGKGERQSLGLGSHCPVNLGWIQLRFSGNLCDCEWSGHQLRKTSYGDNHFSVIPLRAWLFLYLCARLTSRDAATMGAALRPILAFELGYIRPWAWLSDLSCVWSIWLSRNEALAKLLVHVLQRHMET